jgi:hypothetical protein
MKRGTRSDSEPTEALFRKRPKDNADPRSSARHTHDWDSRRFEEFLHENHRAKEAFEKTVANGMTRENLILLMQAASNRSGFQKVGQLLMPSRERRKRLAKHLKSDSEELRKFVASPLLSFFNLENMVADLASHMDTVAAQIETSQLLLTLCKRTTNRRLWNHVGLAWLCEEVRKRRGTYEDAKYLLDAAYEARGRPNPFKEIEREVQRLFARPGGRGIRTALPVLTRIFLPNPEDERRAALVRKIWGD